MEILQVYAERYARSAYVFATCISRLEQHIRDQDDLERDEFIVRLLSGELDEAYRNCEYAGLTMTCKQIKRVQVLMRLPITDAGNRWQFAQRIRELQSRLQDELEEKFFLQLPSEKRVYFENPTNGWGEVLARFPKAISDIEEMAKCFSLARYAASVFHSLLVVEHGLIGLGAFLDVKDHKTGWDATTNELNRIVKSPYEKRTNFEKDHFKFVEQIQATVESLRSSWRHKISHAGERLSLLPNESFTPDIAEEIMLASRSFMRRLSTEMP